MTFRVWLTNGRCVYVDARDPDEAARKLTRGQRARTTRIVPVYQRPEKEQPDMSGRKSVTFGKRSGLIVIGEPPLP